jgi:hypothetical protein
MKSTLFSDFWDPIRDFIRSLMGSLPRSTYGNQVPPELQVFEAEIDEAQHSPHEMGEAPHAHHAASKPVKVGSGYKPQASE